VSNKSQSFTKKWIASVLLSIGCLISIGSAHASDKASASASVGAAPTARLEPFVVNLASFDRYLQTIITLQMGAPESADKVKLFMPMVRHAVITTLSSKDYTEIQTVEGKKTLIEELRKKINGALSTKDHDGVQDIFFENFVIQ
jgi:flagellar FliL protein